MGEAGNRETRPGAEGRGTTGSATAAAFATALLVALGLAGCGSEAGTASAADPASHRAAADASLFPRGWAFPGAGAEVRARRAMVASADSLASAIGLEVMRDGGNAVDAAVAVGFALAVTYPRAGNLGGGGFLLYRSPEGREVALDYREKAPGRATPDMFLDAEGRVTAASWTGHLAVGVPGSVAGLAEAHRRFGSLPWARLVEPAARLAESGFPVGPGLARSLERAAERLARFPATAATFLPGGEPPRAGDTLRQPALARTLRTLAAEGPEAFYRGWIADSLVAEMERGGGLVGREDLAAYRALWRKPVAFDYRGHRILSMPPPSSGGITLAGIFLQLEGFDLPELEHGSADAVHLAVEAFRRAYADRNYFLGDPDFVEIPRERLTRRAYADSLRATIRRDRASPSSRFTRVPRREPAAESAQTTHYSVVDPEGGAVAVTTTLNGSYGSAVTVRGAGFLLNNEMDDFTAAPGVPNAYGLVQGDANAIRPGKRMLSSMSPTLVVDSTGTTRLVTGTPGGSTIITTVFQVVSGMLDHGLGPGEAVRAPRFHHQHLPDEIRYEPDGLRPEVVEELRRRGHRLRVREGFSGDVQSVWIAPDGTRVGVADPRGEGAALGF